MRRVVGIDLGTTNSAIALWTDDGPKLIPTASGAHLTPSVVGLDDDNAVIVGEAAKSRLVTHPERTVASFKRLMGTAQQVRLGRAHDFRPEELSALVLKSLKADAEAHLGDPVDEALISVPAYFNDIQRKATLDAAKIAGLHVERLINEPTAAALAYGVETRKEGMFLVFDLGGGTFDVSLLESFEGVMEVHATAGDTRLGGDDFTVAIAALVAGKHKMTMEALGKPDRARLLRAAEALKRALGKAASAEYQIRIGKEEITGAVSRDRFEEAVAPLLHRIRLPLERALNDSGKNLADLDGLLMVGGATRMPIIRSLAAKLFGLLPNVHIDPDTAVALGAAVQAGLKARAAALDDIVMTDVCPFTLGTSVTRNARTRDEYIEVLALIERNSAVPISRSKQLRTASDFQTTISVDVFQGESRRPENNILLGELVIPVPSAPAGKESIDVRFTYDVNGALEVEVEAMSTKVRQRRIFRNQSNLSEAEIETRFAALAELKIAPRDQTANRELLKRADALYEDLLGEARDELGRLIARFEIEIRDPMIRDIVPIRSAFAEALDTIERSTFRLGR